MRRWTDIAVKDLPDLRIVLGELLEPCERRDEHTSGVANATDMSSSCTPSSFPGSRLLFFDGIQ